MTAKTVHPKYREPQPIKTNGWLSISTVTFKVSSEDADRFAQQLKERYFSYNRVTEGSVTMFHAYVTLNPNDLGTYRPA